MTEQKFIKQNTLTLVNRNVLTVTGVEKVTAFSPTEISLIALGCVVHISGEQLRTEKLDVENGELKVEGLVNLIKWETKKEKTPLLKRIFR